MIFGGLAMMKKTGIKCFWFFLVGAGLFFLSISPALADRIMIDGDDQFAFARTCMEKGEYGRAVGEFERFIHFFPVDPQVPMAHYLIGTCYLKDRRHKAAREAFSHIVESDPTSPLAGKALFFIGDSYYQQGITKESEYYFRHIIEEYPLLDLKNVALYRLGWTRMQKNRWREASEIFGDVEKQSPFYDSSQQLALQSLKGEELPHKSPTCAGALAALVPGLGHAYVSRYKDATVAFLLNGLFIWAAIESFHQDHEVLGGILTFLEIGWYTGNIYSAVNVTHKHNRKVRNDFRRSLKDQLNLHVFTGPKGQVGLALTFKF